MAVICPTVTAFDTHAYREQMELLEQFAERIHIDLMDGQFAPTVSPPLSTVWWPPNLTADIHVMYQHPANSLEQLIRLQPHMVVIHYEADVDHAAFCESLHQAGIKVGLAILQETSDDDLAHIIKSFDHVLVFSGNLGHHGGQADLGLLDKVRRIRKTYPAIEIGWDGGINDQNAPKLVEAGVSVLNVGGFIHKADNPAEAYKDLVNALTN